MRAWVVSGKGGGRGRLMEIDRATPEPEEREILVRVGACGVCRTDLHLADGDLPPRAPWRVPGHQVVGEVAAMGRDADRFSVGEHVGIAWLRSTCGVCTACRRGRENLCQESRYTGWDADGGFAEYAVVPEAFAYRMPEDVDAAQAAPLLCAGIIGYRALRRAQVPPGGTLGLYGFGASAHLTAQIAIAQGVEVHVVTSGQDARTLATRLGCASARPMDRSPPVPLDSAIIFAPVGWMVRQALAAVTDSGVVAVAGIHLSDIPALNYQQHLFRERSLTSVTANTRADGEELLSIAARLGVRAQVTPFPLDRADEALDDLALGRFAGAAVLVNEPMSERH